MWELEKIAKVLKYRNLKSEEGLDNKPSILFCGMDSYQKRDLHSEEKKTRIQNCIFNEASINKSLNAKVIIKKNRN